MTKQHPLTKEERAQEVAKCSQSFVYFLENYCYFNTGVGFTTLTLADRQKELAEALVRDHNLLILGSRQTGKTTILVAYCAWVLLFFPAMSITFISRNEEQAKTQLTDIRELFRRLPEFLRPTVKPDQATIKTVTETQSTIQIQAVLSDPSSKGRGIRSHIVWIDEAAFLPTLDPLLVGLLPTTAQRFQVAKAAGLPYGVIMTTTPNGTNGTGAAFYKLWKIALEAQENPNVYSFFKPFKIHWTDIPFYDEEWYEEEKRKLGPDKIRQFHQEYDLSFIGSEDSFLTDSMMESLQSYSPIEKDGHIHYFEYATEDEKYVIAIDPATEYGSANTAIEVLTASDGRQVAEYINKVPIYSPERECLIAILKKLVKRYANCLVIFENNGIGNQLVEQLPIDPDLKNKLFKPRPKAKYGIVSNYSTRRAYFNLIYSHILDNPNLIKSNRLIKELCALGVDKNGKIGKTAGNTDDAVLALGIGLYTRFIKKDAWGLTFNIHDVNENNKLTEDIKQILAMNKKQQTDEVVITSIDALAPDQIQNLDVNMNIYNDISSFTNNLDDIFKRFK